MTRPYRSHKHPACVRCRQRRTRCTTDLPGQGCLLCRVSGFACSSTPARVDRKGITKTGFRHRSATTDSELEKDAHVLGPVFARDAHVLDSLIPTASDEGSTPLADAPESQTVRKPIYRARVPPRRPSPLGCDCFEQSSLSVIKQIEPFLESLLSTYFEHLHPCLPIMDERSMRSRLDARNNLPRTFVLNLAAYTLFYRNVPPNSSFHDIPSQDVAWQTAVTAMDRDSQRGDMMSITAAILNVAGRPSTGVIHNTSNVARITALAHSAGLNHNCEAWSLNQSEKSVRSKLWWAVLVHDRWFNFAQGTPSYINKEHYDVPVLTVAELVADRTGSIKHIRAAECYIYLCKLTEIVGSILPLIYHVRSKNDGTATEQILQAEAELTAWRTLRPSWLDIDNYDHRPPVPGLENLQLSYLSVEMLLKRLAWHEDMQQSGIADSSLLVECRAAAGNVVRFTLSLTSNDLAHFWLPYNAHHFTSAITLLLRCGLQTNVKEIRTSSVVMARQLVDCLVRYRDDLNWDMAEIVLSQSEAILQRVEKALPALHLQASGQESQHAIQQMSTSQQQQTLENDQMWDRDDRHVRSREPEFQGLDSVEDIFPELFAEFTDVAFFDQTVL